MGLLTDTVIPDFHRWRTVNGLPVTWLHRWPGWPGRAFLAIAYVGEASTGSPVHDRLPVEVVFHADELDHLYRLAHHPLHDARRLAEVIEEWVDAKLRAAADEWRNGALRAALEPAAATTPCWPPLEDTVLDPWWARAGLAFPPGEQPPAGQ